MSKQIPFSVENGENENTPLYDRIHRAELRAELHKYPNFKVPMPRPKKWESEVSVAAYENKLVGWKQLFEHHKREADANEVAQSKFYKK